MARNDVKVEAPDEGAWEDYLYLSSLARAGFRADLMDVLPEHQCEYVPTTLDTQRKAS